MSDQLLSYVLYIAGGLFAIIVIAYLILMKKNNTKKAKQLRQLKEGTKVKSFSTDILYQRLYLTYIKIPFLKRYVLKLRRRLEIINIEDEYVTRKQTASIITKALMVIIPFTILVIILTNHNTLLMSILLIFELFLIETVMDGMADKIDNKLLKQQIDFFAEIRHAYHEYNMVEEAIYEVAQNDELEISRQAEKIYEILISDFPEEELEKYYDVAPNSYLKEFAGISYLTKEFGDRKIDKASLYLKNLNNITQELQLEILKRDKLDYVFQSLSVISAIPILFIEPVKNWAVSQFSFTDTFYSGKGGLIVQMLIIIVTFICYVLTRKLKDNGGGNRGRSTDNPIQAKLYKIKIVKKIVDIFMPKVGTADYRKIIKLMKESASRLKIEWLYVNKILAAICAFVVVIFISFQMHRIAKEYVYEQPTSDYNILGDMSDSDLNKAMKKTEQDNEILNSLSKKQNVTKDTVRLEVKYSSYYEGVDDAQIDTATDRIYSKYQTLHSEYIQWFEVLLAFVCAALGYFAPNWLLKFQMKMRQLEMEDEVMQFQTIILMLMKIERVNVEIILEWLERYSNIFKEPISKCVNNYESGAWEALEELKEDVAYVPLVRIIESLQAAVEKIPIADAFDELDTERAYYQERRKESNERLIAKKGRIGKAIGFAPMVLLFVGYLIVPLVVIGLTSMMSSFSTMSTMM